jgi:transposase-like protein
VLDASKSLGIAANMLYHWKELHEQQITGKSLVEDEREELKRLRKKNKELRMEKVILKNTSVRLPKYDKQPSKRLSSNYWTFLLPILVGAWF